MTIHQKFRMTVAQFLVWAESQPGRYELVDGEPIRMAPERARHNKVKYRVCRAIDDALAQSSLDCEFFTDGMTVEIEGGRSYEPDAAVQCGVKQDLDQTVLAAPLIVVEVASPTTAKLDAGNKLLDYFKVPSIQHYLILVPERQAVIHHQRDGAGIRTTLVTAGNVHLDPPGLVLPIAGLWPIEA